ncbi:MAG: lamin tail domain-containing protein [Candidatus Hadarchaeota archaeon]|nr:lamin tail domain-containing protein [Candidatus Hadarchaeota archaeon]
MYNAGDESETLNGWEIKDNNSDSHIISGDLIVAAGDYAVLCRNDDAEVNGGLICDYEYSGFVLANTKDEIILEDENSSEKDRVDYDTDFPYDAGYSAELKDPSLDNNNKDNWEGASETDIYGDGDHGTPGASN